MKKYRITKVTHDFIYIRWDAYGRERQGLSIKIPKGEFNKMYTKIDKRTCVKTKDLISS